MKKLFLFILIIILIPFLIVTYLNKDDKFLVKFKDKKEYLVKVKYEDGKIIEVPFEEYILGVVAAEMPAEFEVDALKAQAVASRSYVLKKIEQNKTNDYDILASIMNQVYIDNASLKEKWKDKYNNYYKKIKSAVLNTKGEYLTYQGKVIEAFFFSTSSGMTENSEDVFISALPYLRSVESSYDNMSPVFKSTNTFSLKEFYTNLNLDYKDKPIIKILEKSNAGHIKKISIDGNMFKGTEFRKLLNLKSTYFDIKVDNDKVIINTLGNGHGVGMSQYGANYMAKEGKTYKEILKHFYKDVEISKLNV
ncbi:MAG: stage II sporulation protein D [Bacilli bacterium]|nr:stage II sporulation protein D [Bacilli bacterium]